MKVFVTGGTGFVGKEVVQQLGQAGHKITMLTRSSAPREAGGDAKNANLEVCEGSILDREKLERGMKGCEAVIHLVGIISEIGETTFENVHVRGTETVVAASLAAGVRRFLHMSALGTRPNAVSRYHRTKWVAEEAVRASGLEATLFRPSLIYGREDHFTTLFASIVRFSPVVPLVGRPDAMMQPICVENVATAFTGALNETDSIGRTFDLCGEEKLTLKQIVIAIEKALGKRRWKVQIPPPIARLQASVLEKIYPVLFKQAPPLNRDQLLMLHEDNTGNAEPANQLFRLKSIPFADGLAAFLSRAKSG